MRRQLTMTTDMAAVSLTASAGVVLRTLRRTTVTHTAGPSTTTDTALHSHHCKGPPGSRTTHADTRDPP